MHSIGVGLNVTERLESSLLSASADARVLFVSTTPVGFTAVFQSDYIKIVVAKAIDI